MSLEMNDFGHRGTIVVAIAIVVVVVVVMMIDGDPRDANGTLDIEGTQILEFLSLGNCKVPGCLDGNFGLTLCVDGLILRLG